MRRAVHLMMVAFWTSVPLFAVILAVYWPQRDLGWPVEVLLVVVVASSAFLTARVFAPVQGDGGRREVRWTSESLVYPGTLALAFSLFYFQIYY